MPSIAILCMLPQILKKHFSSKRYKIYKNNLHLYNQNPFLAAACVCVGIGCSFDPFSEFNWFCKQDMIVNRRVTSSVKSRINSSIRPGRSCIPCLPLSSISFAIWLINRLESYDIGHTLVGHLVGSQRSHHLSV